MIVLRFSFALLVLAALFYFVGIGEMWEVFQNVDPLWLVLLLALAPVMVWASCLKWQLFIRASGNTVPMFHLMKLYMVGYFFNTFTPSYVGGDVARSFHLGRYLSNQRDAFISTFLERFTGLLAMSFLGVLFLLLGAPATAGLSVAILSVAFAASVLGLICFSRAFASFVFSTVELLCNRLLPRALAVKILSLMQKVDQGMRHARSNKPLLFKALALSLFFHCLTVVNTYLGARSIGWADPDIAGLFVVVPLVLLVSMAPLTPSGLGIQEGAFLFLLQRIGASEAQGLGVGVVLRAKIILLGAVGGLFWLHVRRLVAPITPNEVSNESASSAREENVVEDRPTHRAGSV